jgi:hypothetical protein
MLAKEATVLSKTLSLMTPVSLESPTCAVMTQVTRISTWSDVSRLPLLLATESVTCTIYSSTPVLLEIEVTNEFSTSELLIKAWASEAATLTTKASSIVIVLGDGGAGVRVAGGWVWLTAALVVMPQVEVVVVTVVADMVVIAVVVVDMVVVAVADTVPEVVAVVVPEVHVLVDAEVVTVAVVVEAEIVVVAVVVDTVPEVTVESEVDVKVAAVMVDMLVDTVKVSDVVVVAVRDVVVNLILFVVVVEHVQLHTSIE